MVPCLAASHVVLGNGLISLEFANLLIFSSFSLCQAMDTSYDSSYMCFYKKLLYRATNFRN